MKPTVAIAMSGGIDSLVSAYLLKEEGYRVFGVHFTTGFERQHPDESGVSMADLASQVGIDVHTLDFHDLFRRSVVDYFIQTYRKGNTPNPCLICNPVVKFGELLRIARGMGADLLATGHYARVLRDDSAQPRLLKGVDGRKDQSYFLGFLTREQLSRACFPLGSWTKKEVTSFGEDKGLVPLSRAESQDICFIREGNYGEFLLKFGGICPAPGPIVTLEGEVIGEHRGLHMFTVGQRRGINCPSSEPYYVVRLDTKKNSLVVGRERDLASDNCQVDHLNWIGPPPEKPFVSKVRLRYRHQAVQSRITPIGSGKAKVDFSAPQKAPTPGQGAVFYVKDEVLGAGIIVS